MVVLTKEMLTWMAVIGVVSATAISIIGTSVLSSTQNDALRFRDISMSKSTNGNIFLTISVVNDGTSTVTDLDVGLYNPPAIWGSGAAQPYYEWQTTHLLTNQGKSANPGDVIFFSGQIIESKTTKKGERFVIFAEGVNQDGNKITITRTATISRH